MITMEALVAAISARIDDYNQTDLPLNKRQAIIVPLLDSLNHILAVDVTAPFDVPRQDLSAMDGYAIAKGLMIAKDAKIRIIGESQAGRAFTGNLQSGEGVRIFTGAVVPSDCDSILIQENTDFATIRHTIDKSKSYDITVTELPSSDDHIRRQGEEITKGAVVLSAQKRLNPTDISLLANLGIAEVQVFKPLTVGLIATGDELVALGGKLDSLAQIYNGNTPTIKTLLSDLPINIKDYGIIPDNKDATVNAIKLATTECDVLVSSAGVSVGDYDFLTPVIEEVGKINHYKVAMKPGKPFVFGELKRSKSADNDTDAPILYFGLPGNPLSALVGTLQFVIPALWQLSGTATFDIPKPLMIKAKLTCDIKKAAGRKDFQRGILTQDGLGNYEVKGSAHQQSHRIKQLSDANCFIVLDKDSGSLKAGSDVVVQPFPWSFA